MAAAGPAHARKAAVHTLRRQTKSVHAGWAPCTTQHSTALHCTALQSIPPSRRLERPLTWASVTSKTIATTETAAGCLRAPIQPALYSVRRRARSRRVPRLTCRRPSKGRERRGGPLPSLIDGVSGLLSSIILVHCCQLVLVHFRGYARLFGVKGSSAKVKMTCTLTMRRRVSLVRCTRVSLTAR